MAHHKLVVAFSFALLALSPALRDSNNDQGTSLVGIGYTGSSWHLAFEDPPIDPGINSSQSNVVASRDVAHDNKKSSSITATSKKTEHEGSTGDFNPVMTYAKGPEVDHLKESMVQRASMAEVLDKLAQQSVEGSQNPKEEHMKELKKLAAQEGATKLLGAAQLNDAQSEGAVLEIIMRNRIRVQQAALQAIGEFNTVTPQDKALEKLAAKLQDCQKLSVEVPDLSEAGLVKAAWAGCMADAKEKIKDLIQTASDQVAEDWQNLLNGAYGWTWGLKKKDIKTNRANLETMLQDCEKLPAILKDRHALEEAGGKLKDANKRIDEKLGKAIDEQVDHVKTNIEGPNTLIDFNWFREQLKEYEEFLGEIQDEKSEAKLQTKREAALVTMLEKCENDIQYLKRVKNSAQGERQKEIEEAIEHLTSTLEPLGKLQDNGTLQSKLNSLEDEIYERKNFIGFREWALRTD